MQPRVAPIDRKRSYAAAQISDDTKTAIARNYRVALRAGKPRSVFVAEWSESGYVFSSSQLTRWVARIDAGEAAVSTTKATGAEAALSREQRDIIGGWVLHCNQVGTTVHLADYCGFASTRLGLQLN